MMGICSRVENVYALTVYPDQLVGADQTHTIQL